MPEKKDLFELSILANGKYADLLVNREDYKNLVTFAQNKTEPIYNWFYYKEGFSGDLVWNLLKELEIPKKSGILDPFCGTGNTLLACQQAGYNAIGFDILPLGVFVSNTKLQCDYDMELLKEKIKEISSLKFGETHLKWPDLKFIDIKQAFSRYARNDILFFKEKILEIEDEKIRNFIFLALLSIVGQASNTKKDGGVIRIVRKQHLAPVRYLLRNKLKRMYRDLKRVNPKNGDISAEALQGDARSLDLEPESINACITSPPYLNFVDYTKLYGLELALIVNNSKEIEELRKRSLRSHIGAKYEFHDGLKSECGRDFVSDTCQSPKGSATKLDEITGKIENSPVVVWGYFEDMYMSLEGIYKALKPNGTAALVVGNACLPNLTVDVDLILAEISEQIGFNAKAIWVANARWCDVHGIVKERPVRESIVILEK